MREKINKIEEAENTTFGITQEFVKNE